MSQQKQESKQTYIENLAKKGSCLLWQDTIYVIDGYNGSTLKIHARIYPSGESRELSYDQMVLLSDGEDGPVFSSSIDGLLEIKRGLLQGKRSEIVSDGGIAQSLLDHADRVIETVEHVNRYLELHSIADGEKINNTQAIRKALKQMEQRVSLATYYSYRKKFTLANGNRAQIALSYRRKNFGESRLSAAAVHLAETFMNKLYFDKKTMVCRPMSIIEKIKKTLERTGGLWADPERCNGKVPEDLIAELMDKNIPIQNILNNPEKAILLTKVETPSQSWLFGHFNYRKELENIGDVTGTRFQYGHRVQVPLDLEYTDHWRVDVFATDRATRTKLIELWLTLSIDSYSRCVVGFDLYSHYPDLDAGLATLKHSIYPKDFTSILGYNTPFPYGLCKADSMDNGWMNDSPVYNNIARALSMNGEYTRMDLIYRPLHMPKTGAVIERLFGGFAGKFRERFSSYSLDLSRIRTTCRDKQAVFLEDDIKKIFLEIIIEYHYHEHSALGQAPLDRWVEGIENSFGLIRVPPLTTSLNHMFMPMFPYTRTAKDNEISLFGLKYAGINLPALDFAGRRVCYNIHYSKADMSKVSVTRHGVYLGDLYATRFILPDSDVNHIHTKKVSMLERNIAKKLAKSELGGSRDWVDYLGIDSYKDAEDLLAVRTEEKARAAHQSARNHKVQMGNSKEITDDALENYWTNLSDPLTDFAAYDQI